MMKTRTAIFLTREESVLFAERNESFLSGWRMEDERLHGELPEDDILTIGEDDHGQAEVVFVHRGSGAREKP